MVGNAISLATNDAMSQFVLHLRDSFGNEALLDASTSAFVFASTAPRFCSASVIPLPSNSRIPVSFMQLSLSLSIDGVELSKLQPDGGIRVRVLLLS